MSHKDGMDSKYLYVTVQFLYLRGFFSGNYGDVWFISKNEN